MFVPVLLTPLFFSLSFFASSFSLCVHQSLRSTGLCIIMCLVIIESYVAARHALSVGFFCVQDQVAAAYKQFDILLNETVTRLLEVKWIQFGR